MLNLDNIDSPEAWDCPLVLTSPRSLAACRLVGVKPVELLPSDLLELAQVASNGSGLNKLADLRDLLEHRRLAKLEHCRAIRRYLISQHATDEYQLLTTQYDKDVGKLLACNPCVLPPQDEDRLNSDFNQFSNDCSVPFRRQVNQFTDRKSKLDVENRAQVERRKLLLSTTDVFDHSCSREPPECYTTRLGQADDFGRANRFQRPFQNESCLRDPRMPSPTPEQRHRYNKQRSQTPLSDGIGLLCDRDGLRPTDNVPRSPATLGDGRTSQNLKGTSDEEDKGGDVMYPHQNSQHFEESSQQSLVASERLSESSRTPRSGANVCKSARATPHRVHRRVRQGPHSPRRRTQSSAAIHATQNAMTSAATPTPQPPRPHSVLVGLKCSSEGAFRDRISKCLSQQVRSSTLQDFICRSKITSVGAQWRRAAEAVGLSEEDHKILLLIEKRALEKRAEEMSAEAARVLWEREEEQRAKHREWEEERRKLEIAQRRNDDKAETKRRLALLERNFNRAQRRLAETLRRRDEEAQQRLHKIALQKEAIFAEKKAADSARQAAVEKRLRHLNQELGRYQNVVAKGQSRRTVWNGEQGVPQEWCSRSTFRRQMTDASSLVLSRSAKECVPRIRPLSAPGPNRVTLDPRIVSARMIRDAIERNLAASRVCSVVRSDAAVRAATSRASATIKARSTRARITWTRRRAAQLATAARLRAARGAAVARLRSTIRAGERKIAALLAAKERSVASSRNIAAVAAQLRHNLRGSLSPTTFDRMATEVQHVLRIPSSHSSSRLFTPDHQSHIKLG